MDEKELTMLQKLYGSFLKERIAEERYSKDLREPATGRGAQGFRFSSNNSTAS